MLRVVFAARAFRSFARAPLTRPHVLPFATFTKPRAWSSIVSAGGPPAILYDFTKDPRAETDWGTPPAPAVGTLVPGTLVKVCHRSENFWVRVTHAVDETDLSVKGVVCAFLVQSHPFKLGDAIRFQKRRIYTIVCLNKFFDFSFTTIVVDFIFVFWSLCFSPRSASVAHLYRLSE